MIILHYNFTTGKEVSYQEALYEHSIGHIVYSHALDLFKHGGHVIVLRQIADRSIDLLDTDKFEYISSRHIQEHARGKEIRPAHNLHRMLMAGAFEWKPVHFIPTGVVPRRLLQAIKDTYKPHRGSFLSYEVAREMGEIE